MTSRDDERDTLVMSEIGKVREQIGSLGEEEKKNL